MSIDLFPILNIYGNRLRDDKTGGEIVVEFYGILDLTRSFLSGGRYASNHKGDALK